MMRTRQWVRCLVVCLVFCLCAGLVQAQVVKKAQGSLDDLVAASPRLGVQQAVIPAEQIRSEAAAMETPGMAAVVGEWDRFISENGSQWHLMLDRRTGRPAVAEGAGIPWVPGEGNSLSRHDVREVLGASGEVNRNAVVRLAKKFIRQYPELFGVDVNDLDVAPGGTGEYGGYLWYVQLNRKVQGIPVERAYVVFRVNHGNLVQFGGEFTGAINVDPVPSISEGTARDILAGYLGGMTSQDQWLDEGRLSILPMAPQGDAGAYNAQPGQGVDYHLVYTLTFHREGVMGTWEAKIDAHTGEVISFRDANKYGSVTGGIYQNSNADAEVVRPMPYLNVTNVTAKVTDAGGNYTFATGTATAALTGKYVKVTDSCGTSSLSTSTAPGNLAWGTSTGTDCTTPGVGGAGNTHAARTTYYHLSNWKAKASAWLPSNTWLQAQMGDKVNLNQTCNAYWDGSAVNFFKSGGGCSNTGELPTVFLHEAGHGLDDNDGSPSSTVGSSESYSDINALLVTHQSCVGVNFIPGQQCSGYGNACTACTGIRDADYAKHTYSTSPATPSQLSATTGFHCSKSSSYPGPCGYEGHCESYIMSEVGWDLAARDLPAAGIDAATSWMIADRLFFLTRPTAGEAYACPSITTTNGCGTSNWFTVYRVVDDEDGNLANGTPHAAAIYAAFNRHASACTTVVNTSSSSCPALAQPVLTATAGSGQVALSWPAVTNASKYLVLRNEFGSTSGMTIMASVTTTSYTDVAVATGVTYYYTIQAVGSNASCASAVAAVKSATPTAGTTYSISGTVSGATASGVTMSLTGTATATATTDTSGNYTFSGLLNGTYTVTPSKTGYTFSPTSLAVTISGANQTGKNFTATTVPTYSISGTVSGDTASGVTVNLTGAATGTTTTDTSGNYTFSGLLNGTYTLTPSKAGYTFSPTSLAVTISGANQTGKNFTAAVQTGCFAQTAAYSATYHCPTCEAAGMSCAASTTLLSCRGTTGEANAPNTIDGCADGNSGTCHSDESIESITIASADGSSCLTPGQQATVTVTAYCYSTADYITLFYSTSASAPSWTKVGSTQQATGSGTKTFTWTVTLGGTTGSTQAVRAQLTYNADPGTAACVSGSYNDRDDMAFAVGGTAPTTYSISGTVSGATASGVTMSLTGAATASTTTDTSGNYTFSGLANGTYTVTPSKTGYTFSPTSLAVTISGANQTGKNFTATAVTGDTPLTSGVGLADSVALQAYKYYTIAVPSGATNLTVTLTGLSADVDLYVNNSTTHPTTSAYYGRSYNSGTTNESLSWTNPTVATWCIGAYGYAAGSYTVTATVTTGTVTYSISGTVSGAVTSGVTMNLTGAATATTTTITGGTYTFSGLANGSYTVTPSLSGYTFSPTSIAVTISGASQTGKNFTATATGGTTTLFTNGFDATTGWAQVDTSGTAGTWSQVTSGTYPTCSRHGGTYMAKFNSYNAASGSQTRYYRTSGFAVSSIYSAVTLTFWMYHDTGYSTSADKVQVQVSTNGSTWTNVGTAINRYDGSTGWKQHTIDLTAYKGSTVYLGFLGISAYGNNMYLDDSLVVAQ